MEILSLHQQSLIYSIQCLKSHQIKSYNWVDDHKELAKLNTEQLNSILWKITPEYEPNKTWY